MANNFSGTDMLTEEKTNTDTGVEHGSQPALTTSRSTEKLTVLGYLQ